MAKQANLAALALISPASSANGIAVNTNDRPLCRSIYIGVSGDYDFSFKGSWVVCKGCVAGSILPFQATGARDNSDGSAPAAGEIVFLY